MSAPQPNPPAATGLPKWFWGAAAAVMVTIIGLAAAMAVSYQAQHKAPETDTAAAADEGGDRARTTGHEASRHETAGDSKAVAEACSDCGVVTSVTPRRVRGKATGVGAVAGGVLGGVVGHQFGRGSGNTAMTVLGAVGGGLAGAQVEKNVRAYTVYDTEVRMSDGTLNTFHLQQPMSVGAHVKVVDGSLHLS